MSQELWLQIYREPGSMKAHVNVWNDPRKGELFAIMDR